MEILQRNTMEIDQDIVNKLTNYILNDGELTKLASYEDWRSLFEELYYQRGVELGELLFGMDTYYGVLGFLYFYFEELDNVNILTIIDEIQDYDFDECLELVTISLPENIKAIRSFAFSDCQNLQSITLHPSLDRIEERAFNHCNSLDLIDFRGTKNQWDRIRKEFTWDKDLEGCIIHCDDGEITL